MKNKMNYIVYLLIVIFCIKNQALSSAMNHDEKDEGARWRSSLNFTFLGDSFSSDDLHINLAKFADIKKSSLKSRKSSKVTALNIDIGAFRIIYESNGIKKISKSFCYNNTPFIPIKKEQPFDDKLMANKPFFFISGRLDGKLIKEEGDIFCFPTLDGERQVLQSNLSSIKSFFHEKKETKEPLKKIYKKSNDFYNQTKDDVNVSALNLFRLIQHLKHAEDENNFTELFELLLKSEEERKFFDFFDSQYNKFIGGISYPFHPSFLSSMQECLKEDSDGQKIHGEQYLYHSLFINGSSFIEEVCTYLYLKHDISQIHAIVFDLHSTNDMCPFCLLSLLMHWHQKDGVFEKMSKTVQEFNSFIFEKNSVPYFLPLISSLIPYIHPTQNYSRRDVGWDQFYDAQVVLEDFSRAYRVPQMFFPYSRIKEKKDLLSCPLEISPTNTNISEKTIIIPAELKSIIATVQNPLPYWLHSINKTFALDMLQDLEGSDIKQSLVEKDWKEPPLLSDDDSLDL